MENTGPFLFDDDHPKYILATKGKAIGPLTAQEVFEKIKSGEVGLLHYVWKSGWSDWKRLGEDKEFSILIPQKPSKRNIAKLKEKIPKRKRKSSSEEIKEKEEKDLYLYFKNSQYGPFSSSELGKLLESHRVDDGAYLWRPGWKNWKKISEVPKYAKYVPKTGQIKKKKGHTMGIKVHTRAGVDVTERRRAPRLPMVARIFMHNNKEVIVAVCRDISIGGMQVLTDKVPGKVGSTIKLNVSPAGTTRIKGFVAEGKIVRILEDGRGFSFRFKKLSNEAKKIISKYVQGD